MVCALAGCNKGVSALLAGGAPVDASDELGNTPLIIAAIKGHTDVVNTLLDGGADPNKPRKVCDTGGVHGLRASL